MMNIAVCQKCGEEFNLTGDEDTITVRTRPGGHVSVSELTLYEHYSPSEMSDGEPCGGLGVIIPAGQAVTKVEPEPVRVAIPGSFLVTITPGLDEPVVVRRMVFMPAASDAGWFGASAVIDGPAKYDAELDLDLENSDGPFWKAMREALAPSTYTDIGTRTAVPIEWEE